MLLPFCFLHRIFGTLGDSESDSPTPPSLSSTSFWKSRDGVSESAQQFSWNGGFCRAGAQGPPAQAIVQLWTRTRWRMCASTRAPLACAEAWGPWLVSKADDRSSSPFHRTAQFSGIPTAWLQQCLVQEDIKLTPHPSLSVLLSRKLQAGCGPGVKTPDSPQIVIVKVCGMWERARCCLSDALRARGLWSARTCTPA